MRTANILSNYLFYRVVYTVIKIFIVTGSVAVFVVVVDAAAVAEQNQNDLKTNGIRLFKPVTPLPPSKPNVYQVDQQQQQQHRQHEPRLSYDQRGRQSAGHFHQIKRADSTTTTTTTTSAKYGQSIKNFPAINSRVMAENSKIQAMSNDVFADSPIYYFRMPVSAPIIYFPELGEYVNHPSTQPLIANPYDLITPPFPLHLPITFTSNGKPSHVYKYPQHHVYNIEPSTAKPPSPPSPVASTNVVNLNKGPYTFNGKPTDLYLLQDSYNSVFGGNFYT